MGSGDGHPSAVPCTWRGALMRRPRAWFFRLRGLFNRDRRDSEFASEIETHLQLHIDDNLRAGMTPAEARRNALIKLGGVQQTKESYRDQKGLPMIETTLQDLRFGFRMLRRSPGFSLLAILCLTLGIGANAAVFSWVEGILFRPYPAVTHQERLVAIGGTSREAARSAKRYSSARLPAPRSASAIAPSAPPAASSPPIILTPSEYTLSSAAASCLAKIRDK